MGRDRDRKWGQTTHCRGSEGSCVSTPISSAEGSPGDFVKLQLPRPNSYSLPGVWLISSGLGPRNLYLERTHITWSEVHTLVKVPSDYGNSVLRSWPCSTSAVGVKAEVHYPHSFTFSKNGWLTQLQKIVMRVKYRMLSTEQGPENTEKL